MRAVSIPWKRRILAKQIFKELQRARDEKKDGQCRGTVKARNSKTKRSRTL